MRIPTGPWLERLRQDLRYAVRGLQKSPVLATVIVVSLGLGIGATTAMFSVIDALMLRRLPVRNPQELVAFRVDDGSSKADIWYYAGHGYPEFLQLQARMTPFAGMTAVALLDRSGVSLGNGVVDPGQTRVALVTGSYFDVFGVGAAMGRVLSPSDDRRPDGAPVAVISDAYWRTRFGGARDITGRTIGLNGTRYTVIGVTPQGFSGDWVGRPTDIWIPMMMQSEVMVEMPGLLRKDNGFLRIIARLKPGVTIRQAQTAARVTWHQRQVEQAGPGASAERLKMIFTDKLSLVSAAQGYAPQRSAYARPLSILIAIAALLLVVACANVANLLLARANVRQREIALRRALGASRARLVQQMLAEGLLLAMLAGLLGVVLSLWGTSLLGAVRLTPVQMDSRAASAWTTFDLHPDLRVLAFTTTLCLATPLLFALAPAVRGSAMSLLTCLTGRGADAQRGGADHGRVLAVVQVALSLTLLVGAGLFVRTLRSLRSVDLGFDRKHVLFAWTAPGQTGRSTQGAVDLAHIVLRRVSAIPGVIAVGASNGGLLSGNGGGLASEYIRVEGREARPGLFASTVAITPGYLAAMGLQVIAGRDVSESDTLGGQRVMLVNETWAHFYYGQNVSDAIGRRFGNPSDSGFPNQIIGVVRDTKVASPREGPRLMTYEAYRQRAGLLRNMQLAVRVSGDPAAMATRLRQEVQRIDPALPVLKIDTADGQLDDVVAPERLTAALASIFGALATLIACLGLYGVIAYNVARRTSEIGIRMALGATPASVMAMVIKRTEMLLLLGIVVGVPAALGLSRLAASRLFGVGPADVPTIVGAVALLTLVATLAGIVPASRAARTDPLVALRHE